MYKQPNARWKQTAMRQKEEESSTLYRGNWLGGCASPLQACGRSVIRKPLPSKNPHHQSLNLRECQYTIHFVQYEEAFGFRRSLTSTGAVHESKMDEHRFWHQPALVVSKGPEHLL